MAKADRSITSDTSASTRGGCSFDDLIGGTKYYVCDNSLLLNLEEEETPGAAGPRAAEEKADERVAKLVDHVDQIFTDLATQDKEVESFYIGKTNVTTRKGTTFDSMNHNTWKKSDGIGARWRNTYEDKGYDGLIPFAVVTRKLLPQEPLPQKEYQDQQEYALMLEKELIRHYKDKEKDPRIMNESYNEGNKTRNTSVGYPLYVAVKFKDKE